MAAVSLPEKYLGMNESHHVKMLEEERAGGNTGPIPYKGRDRTFLIPIGNAPSLSKENGVRCFVGENETTPTAVIRYAALGDSYASGIDAGRKLHNSCWRFKDSYPMQLIRSGVLGQNHAFQFLACSGAVMGIPGTPFSKHKSIDRQIKALKPSDLVTLSIGGNDAGFFDILNACVYRFYGTRSGNCSEQLEKSKKLISSDEFADAYHKTLINILAKGNGPHFRLLTLGYSPFFDEALSDDCNNRSFGFWKMWQPKLTVNLRQQLNEISLELNNKIVHLIKDLDDERIVWVDWSPKFKDHLFCQRGNKTISDGDNTWFFDVDFSSTNLTNDDVLRRCRHLHAAIAVLQRLGPPSRLWDRDGQCATFGIFTNAISELKR
ncbi:predicted protein [Histoplasma mississippiense (nom. inval.)]|uniref:predicted protein n=1 Tax=Ajellomyces capsulatus (strain NAm1 / WU24) TaxID=2059318 RepID=UPI000157CC68|nr:predicted protein [Histoplasma mississippiense (nom. inval.)]EDN10312.1 predicted protein [Histoplasma mississippiense (nom. inval.)]